MVCCQALRAAVESKRGDDAALAEDIERRQQPVGPREEWAVGVIYEYREKF